MSASNPGLMEVSKTRKESPVAAAAATGEQPPRLKIDAQKALYQANQSAPTALRSISHDLHALRDVIHVCCFLRRRCWRAWMREMLHGQ